MSGILIKEEQPKTHENETFEKGILRRVVRESWHANANQANIDPKISQMLDEHATRMETMLGSFDYGALCMPHIITNTKKMSYKELVAYLTLLESLGVGYKHWFNSEFANIFLAGLTQKARDTNAIAKHLEMFLSGMQKRLNYYKSRSEKENKSLDALILEFEKKNSGFMKFFRKGELSLLKEMINMRTGRARTLTKRKERYTNIVVKVRNSRK